jgi:hypothetical protein
MTDAELGLGRQKVRKSEPAGKEAAADGQEIAAMDAIAKAAVAPWFAEEGKHCHSFAEAGGRLEGPSGAVAGLKARPGWLVLVSPVAWLVSSGQRNYTGVV